jgi:HPt (histidine-containing phosphotransfer) domain-containing protein
VARPTKLDDLRAKRILDALRDGHSFAGAARSAGIDESTLYDWRRRGADGEPEFSGFSSRVEAACHEAETRCIQVLKSALTGDDAKLAVDTAWKWLRTRRPAEWLEPKVATEQETSRSDGEDLSIDVLESVLAAALSRKKAG